MKKDYFDIQVGRYSNVFMDFYNSICLEDFKEMLPEYIKVSKKFRVTKACSLVTNAQLNTVKNMIKSVGGKLI